MKDLEQKILKKIYRFETKRTVADLIFRIGAWFSAILLVFLLLIDILQQLMYQQTFDLLQLFHEDIDTIRMYIGEVAQTFYEEMPKIELFLVIIFGAFFILLTLFFIKNYVKIKNKLLALKKYWLKH